jgi:hypothetical protein
MTEKPGEREKKELQRLSKKLQEENEALRRLLRKLEDGDSSSSPETKKPKR